MTAINMVVQPRAGAAFIISDSAFTAPDGTLVGNGIKVLGYNEGRWAVGVSGNVSPQFLAAELCAAPPPTLRALERVLPDCMRRAMRSAEADRLKVQPDMPSATPFLSVIGAGWSTERRRPEGFYLASMGGALPDRKVRPFLWYEVPWIVNSSHPDGLLGMLGRDADLTDPGDFDPETDGLTLIEAQRAQPQIPVEGGQPRYAIGGSVALTTVSEVGVIGRNLRHWPDVVGQRITVKGRL